MRAKIKLNTHSGYAGDLHAFWDNKPIPRTGEHIVLNPIFSEGIFLPNEETENIADNLKKDSKKLKKSLREIKWTVGEVIKNSRDGEVQLLIITVNEVSK
ncbi:MAG TPA: hypothetical protein DDZ96_12650 [Porphyromonadaceae bacterium]|jgi:hypothetical protein|nr:hypothetical protein [Porphyromonadaceae bacterium]HBL34645.1 hypothetical protein [Porphyromonadaceae bacterium]HBX21753.1 hypothetical protein [Porphyromonadaceae bacterium]HCM19732.1 hypothetical protein [Porphyromonadaceae bacterium]